MQGAGGSIPSRRIQLVDGRSQFGSNFVTGDFHTLAGKQYLPDILRTSTFLLGAGYHVICQQQPEKLVQVLSAVEHRLP